MLSLIDMCDRPPVALTSSPAPCTTRRQPASASSRPDVPHNWEAALWFDETTSTLLAGDLLTHTGNAGAD